MALDGTYSGLKASIASWLNRGDLTSAIPDFILLAEADLNSKLRVTQMEQRSQTIFTNQYTALPADFLEAKSLIMLTNPVTPMDFYTPQRIQNLKATGPAAAMPMWFTIINNGIEICPVVGSNVGEMIYYKKIPALSDANPTNWLLTTFPHLYLYGALIHSAPWLRDDARVETWATFYTDALSTILTQDSDANHVGPLVMRSRNL